MIHSELTLPTATGPSRWWAFHLKQNSNLSIIPPDVLQLLQSLQATLDGAATEIRKEVKRKKKKSTAVKEPATYIYAKFSFKV
jgi:hypothetical protein